MTLWRTSDPETSREAALSIDDAKITKIQKEILSLYRTRGPMIDEQLVVEFYNLQYSKQLREEEPNYSSDSGLRTRRSDLVKLGMVVDTGERGTTRSGRSAVIWRIA
jgi:hypothetical protein